MSAFTVNPRGLRERTGDTTKRTRWHGIISMLLERSRVLPGRRAAMRVWDIHPGYLNRESLLGEHREVHALFSIVSRGKRGYAHHPEMLRWKDHLGALRTRHETLVAEMTLRGYRHLSPLPRGGETIWPPGYIDAPGEQFSKLEIKYALRQQGRISLPRSVQQLWAQHKYSVLARNQKLYREIGKNVSVPHSEALFAEISTRLVDVLRESPSPGGVVNALQHMWGYVSRLEDSRDSVCDDP
ncbi:MAG: DUF1722 domain-containing protein, partial [Desulfomonilia bacterium]|nr:DUF1722 domain-containing protein [Desulfomonilia bacterium]